MPLLKSTRDRIFVSIIAILVIVIVLQLVSANRTDELDEIPNEPRIEFNLDLEDVVPEDGGETAESLIAPPKTTTTTTNQAPKVIKPTTVTKTTTPSSSDCRPGLSARKSQELRAILLDWSTCSNEDFQFYKVVRSISNLNPSYPNDSVISSSSNRSFANFVDKVVAPNETYNYRVCVVHRVQKVTCGNVVSITF